MECFVVCLLAQPKLGHLEHRIAIVKLLVVILGYLFKVQDSICLLRVLVFGSLGKQFANVVMSFYIRAVLLDHALQVRKCHVVLALMVA